MKLKIQKDNVTHLLEAKFLSKSPNISMFSTHYADFRDVVGIVVHPDKEDAWIADVLVKCTAAQITVIEFIKIYRKGKLRRSLLIQQGQTRLRVELVTQPSTFVPA